MSYSSAQMSFLSLGDWGATAVSDELAVNQAAVANAMTVWAEQNDARFVLNTGDNFYWCGIQNTSDFQVSADFVDVYNSHALQSITWFGTLGNHEYGYNVTAELLLQQEREDMQNWYLPERYYHKRVPLTSDEDDSSPHMSLIVLDTSPCVSEYRMDDPSGWDPCSDYYPTCSPGSSDDDFEGKCQFHPNIMSQNCTEQYLWFQETLASVDESDWLVVMGHHPVDELDVEPFYDALKAHGNDLYINGHVHALQQYEMDGNER